MKVKANVLIVEGGLAGIGSLKQIENFKDKLETEINNYMKKQKVFIKINKNCQVMKFACIYKLSCNICQMVI